VCKSFQYLCPWLSASDRRGHLVWTSSKFCGISAFDDYTPTSPDAILVVLSASQSYFERICMVKLHRGWSHADLCMYMKYIDLIFFLLFWENTWLNSYYNRNSFFIFEVAQMLRCPIVYNDARNTEHPKTMLLLSFWGSCISSCITQVASESDLSYLSIWSHV